MHSALPLKTAWLGLLLIASSCRLALAQPPPTAVDVSLVGLGRMPSTLLLQSGNGDLSPVAAPTGIRSPLVRYRGDSPLRFFTETRDAEGNVVRIPAATIPYQTGWEKVLVVLSASPHGAPEPLRGQTFDDGPAGFPADHVRVFNLYPVPLAIRAGTNDPLQLAPGQSTLLPLSVDPTRRAFVQLALLKEGRWQALSPLGTDVVPNMRILAFVYEGQAGPRRDLVIDVLHPDSLPAN